MTWTERTTNKVCKSFWLSFGKANALDLRTKEYKLIEGRVSSYENFNNHIAIANAYIGLRASDTWDGNCKD